MRRKMAPQPHTALQVGSAGSLGRSGSQMSQYYLSGFRCRWAGSAGWSPWRPGERVGEGGLEGQLDFFPIR